MIDDLHIQKYKNIKEVLCPYFSENIAFNSRGLTHIRFTGQGRARTALDQQFRIQSIHYAPIILATSTTVQGIMTMQTKEHIRNRGVTTYIEVQVFYYEFIAVVDKRRFKVIVKQIEQGQKFFWSIIPYWKKSVVGRKLHSLTDIEL